jgi:hypothetical protein
MIRRSPTNSIVVKERGQGKCRALAAPIEMAKDRQ